MENNMNKLQFTKYLIKQIESGNKTLFKLESNSGKLTKSTKEPQIISCFGFSEDIKYLPPTLLNGNVHKIKSIENFENMVHISYSEKPNSIANSIIISFPLINNDFMHSFKVAGYSFDKNTISHKFTNKHKRYNKKIAWKIKHILQILDCEIAIDRLEGIKNETIAEYFKKIINYLNKNPITE